MDGITVVGSRSVLRAGLVSLLSSIGFESIEEADDVKHLKGSINGKISPEVLIICLFRDRGVEDTIRAVGELRLWAPTCRIVVVVAKLDVDVMSRCFVEGACGYLLERISSDALRESLNLVNAGEKVFPSELASLFHVLAPKFGNQETSNSETSSSELSPRETEILRCLAAGLSNKAIARTLDIAEATVKVHVKRILRKTHVLNRTQAALWSVSHGTGN
jgi:two-component system nitrate/nitrite response regulator NarL